MTAPHHPQHSPYQPQAHRPPDPEQPLDTGQQLSRHLPPAPEAPHPGLPPDQGHQAGLQGQPYGRHAADEHPVPPPSPHLMPQPAHRPVPPLPVPPTPAARRGRFGALAWSALVLGIVGLACAPLGLLNGLTAVAAAAGAVLGVIALFGTRKVLAGIGVLLCVAATVLTVVVQASAAAEFDRMLGVLAGDDPAALQEVAVRDCVVAERGTDVLTAEATIEITNGTDERQSYSVTVSVDDGNGARVAEITAVATAVAPGQSVVLSGPDTTATATDQAEPGPADCRVAGVDRLSLGG